MKVFAEKAMVKMKREVFQTITYEIGCIDTFRDGVMAIELVIEKTNKKYEFFLDYDIKEKEIVMIYCANRGDMTDEELINAHSMIDLLSHELENTIEFMLTLI